jgi:hypothetical protein
VVHTFFTDATISKECSGGAEEPVIVERLYYRYTGVATGHINRRGDHDPSVVDVDEVRALPA